MAKPKCAKQTKLCRLGFTAYVLLRKTQSSVSLRLTAPFKRGLAACGRDGGYPIPTQPASWAPRRKPWAKDRKLLVSRR